MTKDTSTEQKIKDAARRVFMSKGFSGCTSREIAKEAGINVALLNYYFRSKAQLFQLVCHAVMEDFMLSLVDVFALDLSLEKQIRIFIEREYEFLSKHPEIPNFIFNEMSREGGFDECFDHRFIMEKIERTGVFRAAQAAQEKGEMRKVDMVSLTVLIMSNCQFPIMARKLIQNIHELTPEQYDQQLVLHKQYVTEMLVTYLFNVK